MNLSQIEAKEMMPGYHGKFVHGQEMSWAFWEVEQDAVAPVHRHVHEQIMHVVEGSFEFSLQGVTALYGPGDLVVIPPNVPHGGKALTPCKLMDVFCPVREDYK